MSCWEQSLTFAVRILRVSSLRKMFDLLLECNRDDFGDVSYVLL